MRPTLEVQTLIREHGIDHVQELLQLEVKPKGNLVLLKYNQIAADWTKSALYDCRGLILDKENNWEVVAYPYRKFFNSQEGYADKIDWSTAECFEKGDGSLITLYFYNNEWCVSTSGVPDASSTCNQGMFTFAELVWKTVIEMYGSKETFTSRLNPNYNFMFELCTPFNTVVAIHEVSKLLLHGVRDMTSFKEESIDMWPQLEQVKKYSFKTLEEGRFTFSNMTWQDEGYIWIDKNFKRVKDKNPKYVEVHHMKSGVSPYEIMGVVKSNDLDEFCVYFSEKEQYIKMLSSRFKALEDQLYFEWTNILKSGEFETQKDFALTVLSEIKKDFRGIMFEMKKGKYSNIREAMCDLLTNRFLYLYLQDC